jgi:hypothetical protein
MSLRDRAVRAAAEVRRAIGVECAKCGGEDDDAECVCSILADHIAQEAKAFASFVASSVAPGVMLPMPPYTSWEARERAIKEVVTAAEENIR